MSLSDFPYRPPAAPLWYHRHQVLQQFDRVEMRLRDYEHSQAESFAKLYLHLETLIEMERAEAPSTAAEVLDDPRIP